MNYELRVKSYYLRGSEILSEIIPELKILKSFDFMHFLPFSVIPNKNMIFVQFYVELKTERFTGKVFSPAATHFTYGAGLLNPNLAQ